MDARLADQCQALEKALMELSAKNDGLAMDIGRAWEGGDAAECMRFLSLLSEHVRGIAGQLRLLSQC
jgi:hypothetical protein